MDQELSRAAKKLADLKKQTVKNKKATERKKKAYGLALENEAFQDVYSKLEASIERWDRLAKEGVGIKIGTDAEQYRLTNEERISAMDKAEALKEFKVLIDGLLPLDTANA